MRIAAQVVDCTYGRSAAGVRARLEHAGDDGWAAVAEAETNPDGCIEAWDGRLPGRGLYRVIFDSDGYFAGLGASTAYPEVVIIFRTRNDSDGCRVHVTLSPYSYSAHVVPWAPGHAQPPG